MESNPSSALEEILEAPDRLKDLDLDAFAEELERQGYGNKRITLYDIRDELFGQYRERRTPFRALTVEERFRLLTGETSESLYVGRMVICTVTGFANRKPPRDMIDQAQPVRNDETGQWQCPFCLQDNYPDLSEVRVEESVMKLENLNSLNSNQIAINFAQTRRRAIKGHELLPLILNLPKISRWQTMNRATANA